jgi:hypothetical protein
MPEKAATPAAIAADVGGVVEVRAAVASRAAVM